MKTPFKFFRQCLGRDVFDPHLETQSHSEESNSGFRIMLRPKSPKKCLPLMEDVVKREFWYITVIGCVYGFYHTKKWAASSILIYIIAYSAIFSTMPLLAYTVYLLKDQLSYLSQTLHLLIVGIVALASSLTLTFSRSKMNEWKEFYEDSHLCEYAYDGYFDELCRKSTKRKNVLVATWALLYGACGVIGVSQGAINNMFGVSAVVSNVNGAWATLPIIMWAPGDLENDSLTWFMFYVLQGLFLSYCAIIVTSAVIICVTTCDRLKDQYKLLIHGIEKLDARAKEMFRLRFPDGVEKRMQKDYDDCYHDCIVQNVKHHLIIKQLFERFMVLASIPIAVPFFGGALLLGMAMITMTEETDPRIGPKCLAAILATSEAYNMYMVCNIGQDFQELVFDALFYARWYTRSLRCKNAIRIMKYGSCTPAKLIAGKLLVLNVQLFADLVNSAYSIFNLKAVSKNT